MKKTLLTCAFALASVNAYSFDWSAVAFETVIEDSPIRISRIGFKDRHMAQQFCQKLDMSLVSPSRIETLAYSTESRIHDAIRFKVDGGSRVLSGIWGWLPEDESPEKQYDIFMRFDGETEKSADTLAQINQTLLANGITPFKLPAVCEKK